MCLGNSCHNRCCGFDPGNPILPVKGVKGVSLSLYVFFLMFPMIFDIGP